MTHDQNVRKNFGVSLETVVRRILRTFDRATVADLEAGARWYDEAGDLAVSLAGWSEIARINVTPFHAAAVIAHLSPRTSWTRNVAGAIALVNDGSQASGIIEANYLRACEVMHCDSAADVLGTFGPDAHKTRSFARNIHGDRDAVTVDVWALRVFGCEDDRLIKRAGAYAAIEHAYRLAAGRRGVDPSTMQATTWIVARNGRAS